MAKSFIVRPEKGEYVYTDKNGKLQVPDTPIISFIEGDGTGPDIMKASLYMWNAAIEKAYGKKRSIAWQEIYAGEKANAVYNETIWLPEETVEESDLRKLLSDFAYGYTREQMIAGRILVTDEAFSLLGDAYQMTGNYACTEMIGRVQQEQIGAYNGKTD